MEKKKKRGPRFRTKRPELKNSDYWRALGKWLKVVLWKYKDLQTELEATQKRIATLEETVKLISEKLKTMDKD